jgi:RNA polymerase sigma-70 factor, ECF subfamily
LTRVATNLWIDVVRRRSARERAADPSENVRAQAGIDPGEVRDAASRLIETLPPQERAAFLLKEVFDMSLDEIAEMLVTSVGAVKTALHRGRKRLEQVKESDEVSTSLARSCSISPALVDRFVERLNASDLPGLLDLMLDTATVEEVGNLLEVGRQQFQKKGSWLWHAVNVHPDIPPDLRPPKYVNERAIFDDEPLMLGFMVLPDAKFLMAVARLEEADGKIARIRSYNFNPEVLKEIAGILGLVEGQVPYRFPMAAGNA